MEASFSPVVIVNYIQPPGEKGFSAFCPLECTKPYMIEFTLSAKFKDVPPLSAVKSFAVQPIKFKWKHPVLKDQPLLVCDSLAEAQTEGTMLCKQKLDLPKFKDACDLFENNYKSVGKYQSSDASGHLKTRNLCYCDNVKVNVTLIGSEEPL